MKHELGHPKHMKILCEASGITLEQADHLNAVITDIPPHCFMEGPYILKEELSQLFPDVEPWCIDRLLKLIPTVGQHTRHFHGEVHITEIELASPGALSVTVIGYPYLPKRVTHDDSSDGFE